MILAALLLGAAGLLVAVAAHLRPIWAARSLESREMRRRRLEMSAILGAERKPNGTPWQKSRQHGLKTGEMSEGDP